jgi:hypothetical protein
MGWQWGSIPNVMYPIAGSVIAHDFLLLTDGTNLLLTDGTGMFLAGTS